MRWSRVCPKSRGRLLEGRTPSRPDSRLPATTERGPPETQGPLPAEVAPSGLGFCGRRRD